jgi:hypothetical protein
MTPISKIKRLFELFIAGQLYDSKSSLKELPKDIIYLICTVATFRFVFESPFDQKGVLSWLRDAPIGIETIDKENIFTFAWATSHYPLNVKAVNLNEEKSDGTQFYPDNYSYESPSFNENRSLSVLGKEVNGTFTSYFAVCNDKHFSLVDFQRFSLCITHFTLSCIIDNTYLSDVQLYGSQDKQTWVIIQLDRKNVVKPVRVVGFKDNALTWQVNSDKFYRYFKIQSKTGRYQYLSYMSGIEMYGDFI